MDVNLILKVFFLNSPFNIYKREKMYDWFTDFNREKINRIL